MKRSVFVSLIAVFAPLNVVTDSLVVPQFSSGVWYGLVFLTEPITGIVLGPSAGFFSALIGVLVGHTITPRGVTELLFTLGAPIGAAVSGLLFRRRWKLIFFYYAVLLGLYFVTPIAWQLPIWGMWDVYCAFIALLITIFLTKRGEDWVSKSGKPWFWALCAFIGLEADILFRIFVFIPGQTYWLFYGLPIEVLKKVWVAGALVTPLKVAVSSFVTALLGLRLLKILPLSERRDRFLR